MPCTRFSALRQGSSRNSTAISISLPPRGILADLDEHLAGVLAAQQPDQRLRRLLQALHDVLAVLQLALAQPARAIGEELRQPVGVIADEEATDGDAVDQHRREVRPRRHLGRVVLRDDAAERDARERVDVPQHRLEDVATDVVEVHVDALGAGVAQHRRQVRHAVGHAGVEAQLLQDVLALVLGARDAGDATAADLRELADDGADGAGGGGHDDGLTGLGLGDVVEAHVRRQAGHAEDAERGGDRRRLRVELERTERPDARAGGLRDVVRLPATVGEHEIARREGGVARFHHLADGAADHRLSQLHGRRVRLHVVHPAAHVRIQREPDGAHEDVALLRLGQRRVDDLEIARLGLAHGTVAQQHAAVRHGEDCRSPARPLQPPGPSAIVPAMTATTRLAEFVVKTSLRDCSDAVLAQTRRAALDTIGVMLAGAAEPVAAGVRAVARAEGGTPLCTVLGTSLRTAPGWAALANGAAGHAHDFDDTNFALMGHPSVPLFAAALAGAEAETADGGALMLAYVIGFEIDAALGIALNPAHYTRGWHATSSIGTLGCAAAAARLLGLDVNQTRHALGMAASMASGLKENFGSMTKPYHAGHAAQSGLRAAQLAREGLTASDAALEGRQGYVAAVVPDVLRHARPSNGLERKFSMQYCAAAALARGAVGVADFEDGAVRDAATRDLMERVTMVVDPALPHGLEQHAWSRVTVRLVDGTTLASTARGASGHPATPLSDAELTAKFLGCAVPVLGADAAEGVAEQIRRLEDVPDVRALTSRLVAEQE